jgi:hypothetical protein
MARLFPQNYLKKGLLPGVYSYFRVLIQVRFFGKNPKFRCTLNMLRRDVEKFASVLLHQALVSTSLS